MSKDGIVLVTMYVSCASDSCEFGRVEEEKVEIG